MTITRSQIKFEIYQRLMKSPATKGFYTDDKVNSVISEGLDGCSVQMFLADEGWAHKIMHFDTVANQVAIPMPGDVAMIYELRYLTGNVYIPLAYDQMWGDSVWSEASGVVQYPSKFKLVDNNLFFTPPLSVGGTKFLQLEYAQYPQKITKDSAALPTQFDRAMFWWMVYHGCVVLTTSVKMQTDWPAQEAFWWKNMIDMIGMRTRQIIPIKDVEG